MSRWTETWLSGDSGAGGGGVADDGYPGERLGLPETGPGSPAPFGPRFAAILIDWVPFLVVAHLFTENPATSAWALFLAYTAIAVTVAGRTLGHAALGLRVARLDGGRPGISGAVIRTLLIGLALPALFFDADWRGLHDRAAGTIVLRTR